VGDAKILLVSQNDDLLDAIGAWLAGRPGLEVIGRAHSGQGAIDRLGLLRTDLVVLDVMLPDMSGLEATRRMKGLAPGIAVALLVCQDSRAARTAAAAVGAVRCIAKSEIRETLLPAIHEMLRGGDGGSRTAVARIGGEGSGDSEFTDDQADRLNDTRREP
jgi:DNA-binding NarL/FixJ family response regulator